MEIRNNTQLSTALKDAWPVLTRADKKIARVIADNYPIACLETLAKLAARADVSAPSVIRFIRRLGYPSHPEFQRMVHEDIHRALTRPKAVRSESGQDEVVTKADPFVESLQAAIDNLRQEDVDDAATALAGARGAVLCLGGRMSQSLADIFQAHLSLMRPNVETASPNPVERAERLLDIAQRDAIVIFDYAPYEINTASFAQLASEKGATVVLFTDSPLSPVAQYADHIVSCTLPAMNKYGSLVPALAQLELLVQHIGPILKSKATAREKGLASMPHLKVSFET